jgi:spermidine/putrescine transport system permease protein
MNRLRRYSIPYLVWMGILILVPTVVLLVLAFSDLSLYQPGPFSFTLENFAIFGLETTRRAIWNSLRFASIAAFLCFLIGYPVAFFLSKLGEKTRKVLISLLIVPLWSNMLLRINAWEKIFTPSSIFTDVFGISIDLIGTEPAIVIGMVAMYLPFMIFPIFSVLEKMDPRLIEAARDLGANDFKTFTRVIFPLSGGGVISGFVMTLLPAMTSFVLPAYLGFGRFTLIGNWIESKFMKEALDVGGISINQGSLMSLFLMAFSVTAFILITRVDKEGETLI